MTSLDLMTETCVWCIYLKQPPDLMRLWFQCRDESRIVPRRVAFLNLEFYDSNPASKLIDFLASVFSSVVETHSCPVRVEWMFVLNSEYFFSHWFIDWLTSIKPSLVATTGFCTSSFKFLCKHMFLFIFAIFVDQNPLSVRSFWNCPLWYIPISHIFVQISALSTDKAHFFFCLFFWGELSVRCKEWCGEDIQHFVLFFWGAVWDLCKDDVEKI